jgi:hypothetical protein
LLYPEIKECSAKFRKQMERNSNYRRQSCNGKFNSRRQTPLKRKTYLVISSTKRCVPVIEHSKFNRYNVPCTSLDSLPKLLDFLAKIKIPS